jgi:hypothetical protein
MTERGEGGWSSVAIRCRASKIGGRGGQQGPLVLIVPIVLGLPQGAHTEKQTTETVHVRLLVVDVTSVYFLVRGEREQESVARHW